MSEWEKVKLGDICTKIGSGATPKGGGESYQLSGISLIRSQNILDWQFSNSGLAFINDKQAHKLKNVIIEKDDVLLNITGDSVARTCIVPLAVLPARVNQHVAIIRVDQAKANAYFILCVLQSIKPYLLSISASGGTRNALTKAMIENIEINLPPLAEQERIAAILGSLDDKIELNNRINKNLEEQVSALFKRWFVDFEFPDTDGNPYKSAGGKLIDSPLGQIPHGWTIGKLADIADITMGQSPAGSSYNEGGIGEVFYQGRAEFGLRFPQRRLYTTEPKRIAQENSILMSVRAPVGDINLAYEKCCIGRGLSSLYSKTNNNSFLLYTLYSLQSALNQFNGEGTVFGSINKDSLANLDVDIPNDKIICNFDKIAGSLDAQIKNNFFENQRLVQLRDSILPKLMNNEINII